MMHMILEKTRLTGFVLLSAVFWTNICSPSPAENIYDKPEQKPPRFKSVQAVINNYGKPVRANIKPLFAAKGVSYPPPRLTFIALKEEKQFYVFAPDKSGKMQNVLSYPIIGTSGVAGPKLKEGDKQVPEGIYKTPGFRTDVIAHLALTVNYPNEFDRQNARREKRTNLGSDILVHGSQWSTGCLAMGNPCIEELFVLAYDTGLDKIKLVFAPCDLRKKQAQIDFAKQPKWLPLLYKEIKDELQIMPI